MGDRSNPEFLDRVFDIAMACGDRPSREKLDLLLATYLIVASNARTELLFEPGGFQQEQTRQVAQLVRAAGLIRQDAPDLEAERLFQEGDVEGMFRHFKERFGDRPLGDSD